MRSSLRWLALSAALVATLGVLACDDDPNEPDVETFTATLNGANERPTPRTTPATGTATLELIDGETLTWDITMTGITNLSLAHIHIGDANTAGGILLDLSTGTFTATQITGEIDEADFPAPAAPNQAVTFDAMIQLMRTGGAYVNVHTNDGDATPNEGPGDFPGGEIRGQITLVP
ncbi:MAG TPA: CHRD domain-containing protein [Gemmatimonadaceae bacterium]|nr:CHRD domain-containing protein [Gemmatimonadaceae bacterium]